MNSVDIPGMETGKIICDTRAELDVEIQRVYKLIKNLKAGEKVTSGYILYAINGRSLESIFEHQVSIKHGNPCPIMFECKVCTPCEINRCIPECKVCCKSVEKEVEKEAGTCCTCSWGREYFRWTFWMASPEEIKYNSDSDNENVDNIHRGIL